jgi:hypothetical protein
MRLPPPPPGAAPAANPFAGLPTIFTVLGKLGLELPVYTVEHIARPAATEEHGPGRATTGPSERVTQQP